MDLASPAFPSDGTIPKKYSCDGDEVSPPLKWTRAPEDTREFALLVEDPDAPGGTFVHWVLFKIPADATELDEGTIPQGSRQGTNSKGSTEWAGPCPPEDDQPHHYEFLLYALSKPLNLEDGASAEEVRDAIGSSAIARGTLTGRFGR